MQVSIPYMDPMGQFCISFGRGQFALFGSVSYIGDSLSSSGTMFDVPASAGLPSGQQDVFCGLLTFLYDFC